MKKIDITKLGTLYIGDCREALKEIPDNSIHVVVTSPPYWSVRYYNIEPSIWNENKNCKHQWETFKRKANLHQSHFSDTRRENNTDITYDLCKICGALRCQLGAEPDPDMYIRNLIEIFNEIHRILRDDGVFWLNIGDTWISGDIIGDLVEKEKYGKSGCMALIPDRLAIALVESGWIIRTKVIWAKGVSMCDTYSGSAMPEQIIATEWIEENGELKLRQGSWRPTYANEIVFMLTKKMKYFSPGMRERYASSIDRKPKPYGGIKYTGQLKNFKATTLGRNIRDVWTINPESMHENHSAVFPQKLVFYCLKSTISLGGCCSKCGTPYAPIVKKEVISGKSRDIDINNFEPSKPIGWKPMCSCNADTIPCTVLDPFLGSGTTATVAERLGIRWIGVEISDKYVDIIKRRVYSSEMLLFQNL